MFDIFLALMGLICGVVLVLIAPEEYLHGKKYFLLLKKIIFVLMTLLIIYLLRNNLLTAGLFLFLLVIVFILELKLKNYWLELVVYLVVMSSYFFVSILNEQLLLVSILFLYGFPTGTLLWMEKWKKYFKASK